MSHETHECFENLHRYRLFNSGRMCIDHAGLGIAGFSFSNGGFQYPVSVGTCTPELFFCFITRWRLYCVVHFGRSIGAEKACLKIGVLVLSGVVGSGALPITGDAANLVLSYIASKYRKVIGTALCSVMSKPLNINHLRCMRLRIQ